MEKSTEINELVTALVSAQAEFSAVPKGSVNPFFNSKYAGLPEVVEHTTPVLTKHGLSVMQFVTFIEGYGDALTTYVAHTSGQYIADTMPLHLPKNDPQGQGSAITYARRYAYMAALGIVADNDDDGNAASGGNYSKPQQGQSSLTQRVAAAAKPQQGQFSAGEAKPATKPQTQAIWAITHKGLGWDDAQMYDYLDEATGRKIETLETLYIDEAKRIIEALKALQ